MSDDMETTLKVIEEYRASADKRFAELIKRGRRGEKNLELAAATAAGMEHAARNLAKRLMTIKGETNEH